MLLTGISLLLVTLAGGLILEILGYKATKNLSLILAFGGALHNGLAIPAFSP